TDIETQKREFERSVFPADSSELSNSPVVLQPEAHCTNFPGQCMGQSWLPRTCWRGSFPRRQRSFPRLIREERFRGHRDSCERQVQFALSCFCTASVWRLHAPAGQQEEEVQSERQ